jgi:hypothetical protein
VPFELLGFIIAAVGRQKVSIKRKNVSNLNFWIAYRARNRGLESNAFDENEQANGRVCGGVIICLK